MTTENIEDKTVASPGLLLKEAREKQGLTLEDISSRLRLRVEVLEQIEADQFDMDRLATFTRGYYRSYAKVVNVAEADILDALAQLGKAAIEEHGMQSFSRKTKREKHDNRIIKLTWVIFAIILSMSVLWWWQEQAPAESEQDRALITDVIADEASNADDSAKSKLEQNETVELKADTELSELETNPNKLEAESISEQEIPQVESVKQESSVDPKADTTMLDLEDRQDSTAATKELFSEEIQMAFNNDCWLQVKDASNSSLYSGVKKTNQTLKLTGKAPYKLVIGDPSTVALVYKGKSVDLSVYPAGKVVRLTLP